MLTSTWLVACSYAVSYSNNEAFQHRLGLCDDKLFPDCDLRQEEVLCVWYPILVLWLHVVGDSVLS